MSVHQSETKMRAWARERLPQLLDLQRYPTLFAAIDAPRKSRRLTVTQLALLRLLLDSKWRPERDEQTQERYGTSACLTRAEIAEVIGRSTSSISRAAQSLNAIVRRGAAADDHVVKKFGLILFSDLGYCFHPNLGDTERARSFSSKQIKGQTSTHSANIKLADDKDGDVRFDREQHERFAALTPLQRERLLAAVG